MKTKLIKVGNSQGIRIPKALVEAAGLESEVTIELVGDSLIVRRSAYPRAGWAESIDALGPDDLDESDLPVNDWDDEEWEWQ